MGKGFYALTALISWASVVQTPAKKQRIVRGKCLFLFLGIFT